MNFPASSQSAHDGARRGRERRCIASGESHAEAELIRFARADDGAVVPDVAAKLPGRGVWVRAERRSVDQAAKKGGFARSFKAPVKVPEALADQVEALLSRRCLDLLGLMRRAGAVAIGATQVEAAIRANPALVLIEAEDGAAEGREKLMSLHIGRWGQPPLVVACFSATDLGVALGRERVIHASLLQERLASGWVAEIRRLAGFRPVVPASWPASWRSVSWKLGGAASGEDQGRGEQSGVERTE